MAETSVALRPVGNQLATFEKFMVDQMPRIKAVSATLVKPDRLVRVALACVEKTPALRNCTMLTILRSVMQAAELGLEPTSAIGEAYLVPFKDTCQLIVGYRGLIALAYRSGHIKDIHAREVYEGAAFEFEMGLEIKLRHVPGSCVDPTKITHAYCVVNFKDGGRLFDVMTREQIEAIRKRSRAGNNGPWVTDYAEMAKKTVTRRTLKYAPMSVEMSRALMADAAADTGDFSEVDSDLNIMDLTPREPAPSNGDRILDKVTGGAHGPEWAFLTDDQKARLDDAMRVAFRDTTAFPGWLKSNFDMAQSEIAQDNVEDVITALADIAAASIENGA